MNETHLKARQIATNELNWLLAFLFGSDCPPQLVVHGCQFSRPVLTELARKVNDPELPLFLVWLDAIEAVAREGL